MVYGDCFKWLQHGSVYQCSDYETVRFVKFSVWGEAIQANYHVVGSAGFIPSEVWLFFGASRWVDHAEKADEEIMEIKQQIEKLGFGSLASVLLMICCLLMIVLTITLTMTVTVIIVFICNQLYYHYSLYYCYQCFLSVAMSS